VLFHFQKRNLQVAKNPRKPHKKKFKKEKKEKVVARLLLSCAKEKKNPPFLWQMNG